MEPAGARRSGPVPGPVPVPSPSAACRQHRRPDRGDVAHRHRQTGNADHGDEYTRNATWALARMNMILHGYETAMATPVFNMDVCPGHAERSV